MRPVTWIAWAIVALAIIASALLYPSLPAQMATHWNASGSVNGYQNRFWGAFLLPLIMIGIAALLLVIPRIDPLRANIAAFRGSYDALIIAITAFIAITHAQILTWNLGYHISPNTTLPVGIAILFCFVAYVLRHAKRNWFIGVRTPWTLSSDAVWDSTNTQASWLFWIAAVIALAGLVWPRLAVFFIIVPAIAIAIYVMVYSYVRYQREH